MLLLIGLFKKNLVAFDWLILSDSGSDSFQNKSHCVVLVCEAFIVKQQQEVVAVGSFSPLKGFNMILKF